MSNLEPAQEPRAEGPLLRAAGASDVEPRGSLPRRMPSVLVLPGQPSKPQTFLLQPLGAHCLSL